MAPTLRTVLADDHAVVWEGLEALIEAQPDMRVVGEAGDGEAAWHVARERVPDVLVIDLSMPVLGGADATARVRRDCPTVKVLAGNTIQPAREPDDSLRACGRLAAIYRSLARHDDEVALLERYCAFS